MARLSGLQRDVLALYRKCLRESRKKPAVSRFPIRIEKQVVNQMKEARKHFEAYARYVDCPCLPCTNLANSLVLPDWSSIRI